MKSLSILLILGLATIPSAAQTRFSKLKGCSFVTNPASTVRKKILKNDKAEGETITVRVIFHVIYANNAQNISKDLIEKELADLNRDFSKQNKDTAEVYQEYKPRIGNPNIHFQLADTTFVGSSDKGIKRVRRTSGGALYKSDPVINPTKYLNVYTGVIGSDGFTYSTPWYNPKTDAVYLYYEWVGGSYRLLTHEVGHWFGLYHIFEGGCKDEDEITDTPPQKASTGMGHACKVDPTNQCPGATVPMFNNYMDYSDCRYMFTTEQARVMRQIISTYRQGLLNK